MGLLSRLKRRNDTAATPSARVERVLVISDIHLGEDVLDTSDIDMSRYISALNRELAAFVSTHRQRDADWHLVINGDMFDFVKINAITADAELVEDENTPVTVARKLDRIFEIHRPLFKELAEFVRAGHRLTLIEGNHDAETFFPEVRERFVSNLAALGHRRARERGEELNENEFVERIAFQTWFEADPGRFHIEHGHAYDEFCAFEYNLAPYDRPGADRLATPLTHTTIPLIARALGGEFSTHGIDNLSSWQHLRRVLAMGPRVFWVMTKLYFHMLWEVLAKAVGRGRRQRAELAELHRSRLEALSAETPYGFKTLEALDAIRAMPAEYSVTKMVCAFHADRLFVIGLGVTGLALGFFLGGIYGWVVAGAAGVTGAVLTHLAKGQRSGNAWRDLEEAAGKIAGITGARYVIFGHSHRPVLLDLEAAYAIGRFGERAYYLNSGSWVTREILRGEEGRGMTYIEIGPEGATLRRWRSDGSPEQIAATGVEAPLPPPEPELLLAERSEVP
ncbi:MAG: metallophosphoesterase [Myxococcota bacterium]